MPEYRHRSELPFSPERVFEWHGRLGAFERLSPPWATVRVLEREGTIRDGDRVVLELEKGPLHLRWELRHRDHEAGRQFVDEQVSGPFERWVHHHRFLPSDDGGCVLEDHVEWEGPLPEFASVLTGAAIRRELIRLFEFRRRRLLNDLGRHAEHDDAPPLTVAVTGSSGLIGSALRHFLTAGGHRVIRVVRSRQEAEGADDAVYWSVEDGEIDAQGLAGADAVVHLAGEPLVQLPRWTDEKKRRIRESRVKGTELLSGALAGLHGGGPSVLVSASAVGVYGGRGDEVLTEDSAPGKGFLADVCKDWERATRRARGAGLRVVLARNGLALSPAGGMLEKVLVPFKMGMGGRVGSGRQYHAWIDLDDVVGVLHHALVDDSVSGPVNVCAPHPVTNAAFASVLGRVLGRPSLVPVPAFAVKAGLGEMGQETILQGQRAKPARILSAGYRFAFEGLEESLRFQLGRQDGGAGD